MKKLTIAGTITGAALTGVGLVAGFALRGISIKKQKEQVSKLISVQCRIELIKDFAKDFAIRGVEDSIYLVETEDYTKLVADDYTARNIMNNILHGTELHSEIEGKKDEKVEELYSYYVEGFNKGKLQREIWEKIMEQMEELKNKKKETK